MQPLSCATTVTRSFSRARRAWAESAVPLNHMFLVTRRRLLVRMPSPVSTKFCECSGVAMRKMSLSGMRADDEQRGRIEGGQRDAFSGPRSVCRLVNGRHPWPPRSRSSSRG